MSENKISPFSLNFRSYGREIPSSEPLGNELPSIPKDTETITPLSICKYTQDEQDEHLREYPLQPARIQTCRIRTVEVLMDGLRYAASWEPGFPFFGIVSPAAALYLSFRNWYTILICFCISVCWFLYFSQTSWISLSSGRALIFRLPT